jgi:hypothetical protein
MKWFMDSKKDLSLPLFAKEGKNPLFSKKDRGGFRLPLAEYIIERNNT